MKNRRHLKQKKEVKEFFSERKYSNLFKKGSSHFCQIQQLVAKDKQFEIEKMKKMIKSVSTRFRKTFFFFFLFVCFKSNKMKQTCRIIFLGNIKFRTIYRKKFFIHFASIPQFALTSVSGFCIKAPRPVKYFFDLGLRGC